VVPGTDPVMGFRRRRMMVPLTEATIEFDSPDGRQHSRSGTILVNRDLTDWIVPQRGQTSGPPSSCRSSKGAASRRTSPHSCRVTRRKSGARGSVAHQGGKLLSARRGAGAAMTGRRAGGRVRQ
jgi:hypothetical protein